MELTHSKIDHLLSKALNQSRIGVLILDQSGKVLHVNQYMSELTGFDEKNLEDLGLSDVLIDISINELCSSLSSSNHMSILQVPLKTNTNPYQTTVGVEVSYLRMAENDFICLFIKKLLTEPELGKVLMESEQMLRAVLNHHFQMTGMMDAEGHLLMANETALKLVDVNERDVIGQLFWETPWWQHSRPLQVKIKKSIAKARAGEFVRIETEHPDTDGNLRIVDFSLTPISLGDSEKINFIIPEGRDITEIKQKEKALENALNKVEELKNRLQDENTYLKEEIKFDRDFNDIVGSGSACKEMLRKIKQVAGSDANVIILGESGTGKELVARSIHELSRRNKRALVKVNCAALTETLIESELFGHEKGAFTGAISRRVGRFELANEGTIFLDEIGEIPLGLQTKLLRVLQEGEFERLGSSKTQRVNVRVVAATNRDLEQLVKKGAFREDLYYRLNVFPVNCPSLRERKEDIPVLVNHFIRKYSPQTGAHIDTVPQKVIDALVAYPWPGNIRELENIIERALIISRGRTLQIGPWLSGSAAKDSLDQIVSLEENERRHIVETLKKTSWRVSGDAGASKVLEINPQTLVSRMKKLGISRPK